MQRGNILGGSADLEVALQSETDLPPETIAAAKLMLANAKLYTNQPKEALRILQDGSQILPVTPDLLALRATILLANGMYSEALSDLLDAREGASREKEWSGPASFLHKTVPVLKANIEGAIEALIGEAYIGLGNTLEARSQF